MLKKFLSIVCIATLSTVFVGCEPANEVDSTPDVVDTTTDTDTVVTPDATTPAVDPAVDGTTTPPTN